MYSTSSAWPFLSWAEDMRGVNKRVIVFSAKDRIFVHGERQMYTHTTLPTLYITILTDFLFYTHWLHGNSVHIRYNIHIRIMYIPNKHLVNECDFYNFQRHRRMRNYLFANFMESINWFVGFIFDRAQLKRSCMVRHGMHLKITYWNERMRINNGRYGICVEEGTVVQKRRSVNKDNLSLFRTGGKDKLIFTYTAFNEEGREFLNCNLCIVEELPLNVFKWTIIIRTNGYDAVNIWKKDKVLLIQNVCV